jgi:hypothetical protein
MAMLDDPVFGPVWRWVFKPDDDAARLAARIAARLEIRRLEDELAAFPEDEPEAEILTMPTLATYDWEYEHAAPEPEPPYGGDADPY